MNESPNYTRHTVRICTTKYSRVWIECTRTRNNVEIKNRVEELRPRVIYEMGEWYFSDHNLRCGVSIHFYHFCVMTVPNHIRVAWRQPSSRIQSSLQSRAARAADRVVSASEFSLSSFFSLSRLKLREKTSRINGLSVWM